MTEVSPAPLSELTLDTSMSIACLSLQSIRAQHLGSPRSPPASMHSPHLKREDDAQPSGCWAVPSFPVAAAPSTACEEETQGQALGLHDLFSPSRQQETCVHLSALQSPKRGLRGVHCHVGGAVGWCDRVRSPHKWFWPPRLCSDSSWLHCEVPAGGAEVESRLKLQRGRLWSVRLSFCFLSRTLVDFSACAYT